MAGFIKISPGSVSDLAIRYFPLNHRAKVVAVHNKICKRVRQLQFKRINKCYSQHRDYFPKTLLLRLN